MFDVGWTELMVIGVVSLVVIGPKDLPDMFRTMGRFTAKARSMARDFQRAMEAAADEAGVKDVADDLKKATSARSLGLDALKAQATKFEKWDPLKPAAKAVVPSAASASMVQATAAASPSAAVPPAEIAPAVMPVPPALAGDVPARTALGPATQALADAQAAKRASRAAAAPKVALEVPAKASAKAAAKPRAAKAAAGVTSPAPKPAAAKPSLKPAAPKAAAAKAAAAKPAVEPANKPARKSVTPSPDARKPDA